MNILIKAAVASAIAAASVSAAQALGISSYAGNAATNVNVFVSGSTAVDTTFLNVTVLAGTAPGGFCQAGTIDVYTIGSPTNRLVYCSASAQSGITAGTPLAIFKESNQGSGNGVGPLINVAKGAASGVSFISPAALVAAGGDAACTTSTVAATSTLNGYTLHNACPSTAVTPLTAVPTGGLADVEGPLLRGPNNSTFSSTDINSFLTSIGTLDVIWGVPVTKALYYALQAAEYPGVAACVNSDAVACAPSLSKAQVAALYQGNIFDWSQLGLHNTQPAASPDNNVYICRRDIQSGTQASFEAYFMGARCSLSSEAFAGQDGQFVFSNPSGGSVRSCLTALQNGGTIAAYNADFTGDNFQPATFTGAGRWGIGVLSTEVSSANITPDTFRMIAIDGVLPTIPNAINGYYPYWSSGVAYTLKAGKIGAPTGSPLTVWNTLSTRLGDPAPTALINANYAGRPWGSGGDMSPAKQFVTSAASVSIPATTASVVTNTINSYTKASGGSVNNCDTPVLYFPGISAGYSLPTAPEATLLGSGKVNQ